MFKAGTNQGLSEGKRAVEDEPVDAAYPALKFVGDGGEEVAGSDNFPAWIENVLPWLWEIVML